MAISIELSNFDEVVRGMKDCQRELARGARRTMLDLAKSGANTVARSEVTKVYNIKKMDVSAQFRGYKQTGSISLAGVQIPFFDVKWTQARPFTPTHFQMTPEQRPGGRRRYTVKWKPLRAGGKEELASPTGFPVFLAAPSGPTLPWVRTSPQRKPIRVVRTHLSVPQMIDNGKVAPHIQKEIEKRIEDGLGRYLK